MMKLVSSVLVSIVGLLHVWFMVLEMYFWTRPLGLKTFGMTEVQANSTKVLAMNQGLYNGFLALGLFWGVCSGDFTWQVFFLSCVIAAGVFGALTASFSILYVQALPALVALIFLILTKQS